jgi:hypothetical protein
MKWHSEQAREIVAGKNTTPRSIGEDRAGQRVTP